MAELKGYRLGVDDGGRPVVDDGGRLVYVKVTEAMTTELEDGQGLVINPAQHTETLHPENTTPQAAPDVEMMPGDDPGSFTVPKVRDHLATADPAEVDRVLSVEQAGKARATILSWPA